MSIFCLKTAEFNSIERVRVPLLRGNKAYENNPFRKLQIYPHTRSFNATALCSIFDANFLLHFLGRLIIANSSVVSLTTCGHGLKPNLSEFPFS